MANSVWSLVRSVLCVLFLLVLISLPKNGLSTNIDSVIAVNQSLEGAERIAHYSDFLYTTPGLAVDDKRRIAGALEELAIEQNNPEANARSKMWWAECSYKTVDLTEEAFRKLAAADSLVSIIEDPTVKVDLKAFYFTLWGFIHKSLGDYDEAITAYHRILGIADLSDKIDPTYTQNRLGIIYSIKGQSDSSVYYYNQALKLVADTTAKLYFNLLANLGYEFQIMGEYKKARDLQLRALMSNMANDKAVSIPKNMYNLGLLFQKVDAKKLDINFAKPVFQSVGVQDLPEYIQLFMAKAREASVIEGNNNVQRTASEVAMRLYISYGPSDSLTTAFRRYKKLRDKQVKLIVESNTSNAKVRYQTLEKEKENILLSAAVEAEKSERRFYLLLVIAVVLLLCATVYFLVRTSNKNKAIRRQNALISHQKEELKSLDQFKSNFFANISHELRTPLTLIIGPIENLIQQTNVKLPDLALSQLKLTMVNAKKLQGMVTEILDLTKLEVGKLELQLNAIAMDGYLKRVLYAFESVTAVRKIHLEFNNELSQDLALEIDHDKLEKVLNNLVSNAIKFSPSGSAIKLRFTKPGGNLYQIEVADQGKGIPTEDLEKVFDRFYQSKNQEMEGGTGIGLALSRELARLMDGELTVTNGADTGAVFTFSFKATEVEKGQVPGIDDALETVDLEDIDVLQLNLQNKPHVLVVEDNPEMRTYIKNILGHDFKVYEAANGKEGLEVLDKRQIDLITSDVMMPEMGGFDFLTHLKTHEQWSQIPVIMLTARADEDDKLGALKLGVDDYITKPFYARELLARIRNLLTNLLARRNADPELENEEDEITEDEKFMNTLQQIVKENISNTAFTVADLAESANCSERTVLRKLKSLKGITATSFIKEMRLLEARRLLERQQFTTVQEVMIASGFKTPSHFSAIYYKRFGKSPKEYFD